MDKNIFCGLCGGHHPANTECPAENFVWEICESCGAKNLVAGDVPLFCQPDGLVCGQCGTKGKWHYEKVTEEEYRAEMERVKSIIAQKPVTVLGDDGEYGVRG